MKLAKCNICDKPAVWFYMPASDEPHQYCDDCVDRGCSCNEDQFGVEDVDEQGRFYPCCEFNHEPDGRDLDIPPLTIAQLEMLDEIADLRNDGEITSEEYLARHKQILNSLVNK